MYSDKCFTEVARWINCAFVIDGDTTDALYREPSLEMYQTVEKCLSIIWGEHDVVVVTDKNSYTFLPF